VTGSPYPKAGRDRHAKLHLTRGTLPYRVRRPGLSKGTHPKIVQKMSGHANISMTMDTYTHVLPDMQEKAVSAMDDAHS
jgi:integrase